MKITPSNKMLVFITSIAMPFLVKAQEEPAASAEELAKKLSNPVAGLISVPLQNNIDYDIGPFHGSKYTLNFSTCDTNSV